MICFILFVLYFSKIYCEDVRFFLLCPPPLPSRLFFQPSDELSDLPLRVAELTRDQRHRRERERDEHKTGSLLANGIREMEFFCFVLLFLLLRAKVLISIFTPVEAELDQIDFIDSCTGEEEEEDGRSRGREPISLSSQFMAYIERRITREVCVCVCIFTLQC